MKISLPHMLETKRNGGLHMRRMAGLWAALLLVLALTPVQAGAVELPIRAEAALLMEKETGQVLYAQNEHEAL